MAAALQRGQVTAASLVEPFLSEATGTLHARVVADQGSGPVADFPLSGYYATEGFVARNPRTVAAFQRALRTARQLATQDAAAVRQSTLLRAVAGRLVRGG